MKTAPSRSRLIWDQCRQTNLTMNVLIRIRHVTAAEPDRYAIAVRDHGWIADHFRIPGPLARNDHWKLFPALSVARTGQSQPPNLGAIASRVEHPVITARRPNRRLAQSVGIERPVFAQLQNRIGAQLVPL